MGFFLQRWNGDGFEIFSPSPLMVFGGINHWQQWFFQWFFSNFGDQWFTMVKFWGPMVHDGYKLKFSTNCMKIKMLKTEMQGIDLFHKKFTFYILHRESLIITHGMKN